jgi:hypothetical protein
MLSTERVLGADPLRLRQTAQGARLDTHPGLDRYVVSTMLSRSRDDARVSYDEFLDTMFRTCTLLLHTSTAGPG